MNQKLLRVIMSAALLLGAWLLTRSVPMPVWQQLIVYLIPYLLIGYDVLAEVGRAFASATPSMRISLWP